MSDADAQRPARPDWHDACTELHVDTRGALERAQAAGRLSRALLLSGPEGVGKSALALWLARRLWCTGEPAPCGVCAPCRKVLTGNHPDLEWVERGRVGEDGKREGQEISVGAVRELGEALARSALEAPGRLAVVQGAEQLNEEAQNALLKLLEEPPGRSRLVLVAHQQEGLLDTVRSRCQELRVSPLADADMARLFPDLDAARLALACGRPGRVELLRALDPEALLELVDATLAGERDAAHFVRQLAQRLEELAEALPEHDSTSVRRVVLDVLLARVVDLAWAAQGAEGRPRFGALRARGAEWPPLAGLQRAARALHEALGDLHRNLPPRVAWLALAQEFVAAGVGGSTRATP